MVSDRLSVAYTASDSRADPQDRDIAPDRALAELIALFVIAEQRIRELVAAAPSGSRRDLARLAGLLLAELRRESAPRARSAVDRAHAIAWAAIELLLGIEPVAPRFTSAGDALARKLDAGAQLAAERTREAIRTVTTDSVEVAAQDAPTAFVDAAGNRWTLTVYSAMTIETIGRQSLTFGTVDRLGLAGERLVTISDHGTKSEVCRPFEGKTYELSEAPWPPYHERCKHRLLPAGFTEEQHAEALEQAAA